MNRDELNENLKIVKQYMTEGKLHIVKDLRVIESLKKVRYASDGKVNPDTVDGLVRSLALAVSYQKYEDDLRKIPLKKTQEEYFELLELFFSHPYEEMIKNNVTPHQIATSMTRKPSIVKAFAADAENFEKGIMEFWQTFGEVVRVHIQDIKGLKTVFGGDIFPAYRNNILSGSGLYVDTTILPDPMLRVASFMRFMPPEQGLYYMAKHALSALSLKNIILANVSEPIAIISADPFIMDENAQKFIASVGEKDLITHLNYAFGTSFKESQKLDEFLKKIKSLDELKSRLKNPKRILFDLDWENMPFKDQWEKHNETVGALSYPKNFTIGEQTKFNMTGRMMQINEILFKANNLHGIPIIDAPTSWQYFLWKYEYDKKTSNAVNPELTNTVIVNAMQSDRLAWLGNIPSDALIKLRQEGALHDLRKLFSKGIKDIQEANDKTYKDTVDGIIGNINEEFYKHSKQMKTKATELKKFFGYNITPWIVTGGISMVATATQSVPLSLLSFVSGTAMSVGGPNAVELWKKGKKLLQDKKELQRSPIGIMFDIRNRQYKKSK